MTEFKRVSFKVAKAIKEAGYPQEKLTDKVYLLDCDKEGKLAHYQSVLYYNVAVAPTYLEVWLWLWREKNIQIDVVSTFEKTCFIAIWKSGERIFTQCKNIDPEEAIIAALEYLTKK